MTKGCFLEIKMELHLGGNYISSISSWKCNFFLVDMEYSRLGMRQSKEARNVIRQGGEGTQNSHIIRMGILDLFG